VARPSKEDGQSLDARVAFRLTYQDYAIYRSKVAQSGLSASEFFRMAVLENRTEIVVMAPEVRELAYHFGRIGNTLNNLAKQLDSASRSGRIDQQSLDWLLANLIAIADYLKELMP